jgi:methionyl-tRNA formyltransferase
MKAVFLGTPEFAVPTLRALVRAGHEIAGVFTQPDRPKGRGNQLAQPPVKIAAEELGLSVYQPERVRRPESVELLRSLGADIMVVVGYGQIIPQNIIDLPSYGILNVHASLLPKYRGAAPIQWAIANGEQTTGVTIMQIDAGLDTGDMLEKASWEIGADETAPELGARLAPLGADLLVDTIQKIEAGRATREPQKNDEATLAPILKKEDGLIDWNRPAAVIYNRFRGFQPWPGAYTTFRGQQLSITRAALADSSGRAPAGTLIPEKRRLFVGCGDNGRLEILELQPAGKKRMAADAFLNGLKLARDERLGDGN